MDEPPGTRSASGPEREEPEAVPEIGSPRIRWSRLGGGLQAFLGMEAVWAALGILALFALTWRSPWGVRYGKLFEGRIVESDIVAPFDVEIADEARTAERIEQARRAVNDVYVFDAKAAERLDLDLQSAFSTGSLPGGAEVSGLGGLLRGPRGHDAGAAMRQIAQSVLTEMIVARKDTLPQGRAITVRYFGEPTEIVLRDLSRIIDLEEAKRRVREAAGGVPGLSPGHVVALGDWMASLIQPTLTYDLGETRRRMDEAARQVPVLYSRIPRGTTLVRKGSPLTQDVIRELQAVQQARPRGFDPSAMLGTLLITSFFVLFLWRFARDYQREYRRVRNLFSFLMLALIIHAALGRSAMAVFDVLVKSLEFPFDRPETLWYLIPTASGAVLVALLASNRIAMVYSLFASALFAILFNWSLPYGLFALLTHLAGIYGLTKYRARAALMRCGLIVGIAGACATAALDAVTSSPWQTGLTNAVFALLGGVIGVPLLVAFLLPIFEWIFGVLTDIRLLELSNLDNPLLSELALRAPGSYNHSIIVGTLAEAAAEAIGANSLFCRVSAFYHDIGKMKMPEYYIENQRPGENPHDRLAPSMSALIISNHVKEGIRLGREHGLPDPILDIIPQHHGTRVMTYFYEKAKAAAQASGAPFPNPDEFRHPGPKPATKEAAIFMLSDSVEAAARTIAEPSDERFREMIRQIASRVILDGQFDQCDLTFKDLEMITEAFVRTLGSIYHHRIDYPTFIFEGAPARRAPGAIQRSSGEGRS